MPVFDPDIGQAVVDLTSDDLGVGVVIDFYENRFCGPLPTAMLTVDFGDDRIFDRLPSEVGPAPANP